MTGRVLLTNTVTDFGSGHRPQSYSEAKPSAPDRKNKTEGELFMGGKTCSNSSMWQPRLSRWR